VLPGEAAFLEAVGADRLAAIADYATSDEAWKAVFA
jgi:hypothetical protein